MSDEDEASESRANAEAIADTVRRHTGLSWGEYCNRVPKLNLARPQLPQGMIDAAAFMQAVQDSERVLAECRAQIEALRGRIAGAEQAESILAAGNPAIAAAFANGQRARLLQDECDRLEAEEAAHMDTLSLFVNGLRIVDGQRLQTELAPLLRRRLELMLANKRRVAEGILAQRGA